MTASAEGVIYISKLKLQPEHPQFDKLGELHEFYCSQFGATPEFFVRLPGRVNIIGEHVDYCGYPVLPMAIDQCIFLAVGQNADDTSLQLCNVDSTRFESFKTDLRKLRIDVPTKGGPKWYNYYLCGVQGIYDEIQKFNRDIPSSAIGMTVALSGNIPPSSGLSSSSALVSAAVLATAYVHRLPLERRHLASISARCERYIGTEGGGMDQAIAYLAKSGCAQFIEFHPHLRATPIRLPAGLCFIVVNSLAAKNKAASSDFNERVVECRLATRILAKHCQLKKWREMSRFIELQEALQCTLGELGELVLKWLPNDVYSREELCARELEMDDEEFENEFLTANTRQMRKFKLRQRALHVIRESQRVVKFREICEKNTREEGEISSCSNRKEGTLDETSKCFAILSQLMRQSHQSLKELYECSHPNLDRLVAISDAAGVGARLTGAGWGGCIVACCDSIKASKDYIQTLKEKYFKQLPQHLLEQYEVNDFNDVVFATFPGNGAEIFTLSNANI